MDLVKDDWLIGGEHMKAHHNPISTSVQLNRRGFAILWRDVFDPAVKNVLL